MTNAVIGYGAELRVGVSTASPTATVLLGEVTSVPQPTFSRAMVDATHMASPNRTMEFIPGLFDPGEYSVEMNWIPGSATDLLLIAMQSETTPRQIELKYTQVTPNRTYKFTALLKSYDASTPIDDKMAGTAVFQITGAVTAS